MKSYVNSRVQNWKIYINSIKHQKLCFGMEKFTNYKLFHWVDQVEFSLGSIAEYFTSIDAVFMEKFAKLTLHHFFWNTLAIIIYHLSSDCPCHLYVIFLLTTPSPIISYIDYVINEQPLIYIWYIYQVCWWLFDTKGIEYYGKGYSVVHYATLHR